MKSILFAVVLSAGLLSAAESDETAAIQSAIDRASAAGGGVVSLPAGVHLSSEILLKSGVTLKLEKGAVLKAIADPACWPDRGRGLALVRALGARDIAIVGEGAVDGDGAAFPRNPSETFVRFPRLVHFTDCTNVTLRGVTLRDPARWTCFLEKVDGFRLSGLTVHSHANVNNDGLDLAGRNGLVEDCTVSSDDDAIVFKNFDRTFVVENIEVRNCRLSSNASVVKTGTETFGRIRNINVHDCTSTPCPLSTRTKFDRKMPGADPSRPGGKCGIAVIVADGGSVEGFTVSRMKLAPAYTPFFVRLERRHESDGAGLSRVLVEDVEAEGLTRIASSVTGVEGLRPRDILFRNVRVKLPGGGTAAEAADTAIPENPTDYPSPRMFGCKALPAYGFYVRHADDVRFENVTFDLAAPEARPAYLTHP